MLHSKAIEILGMLAVKLEIEMRFKEREALEYAIGKLTETPAKDPMVLAQQIYQSADEANDIVTRLRLWATVEGEDSSVTDDLNASADEIERLRTLLDNTLERENKDNARQLDIVRKVEADRDRWMKAAKALIRKCGHDSHCPAWLQNPAGECECGFDKPLKLYIEAMGETNETKLGDIDSDGYVRIHSYELGQLIKQANGSYNMMNDLNAFARDRNRWRAVAEVLARELGKVEYADAEWRNQEGLH